MVEPYVPVSDVMTNDGCPAPEKVTVVGTELLAAYLASAALVAVTTHVPTLVALKVVPLTEHPAAEPLVAA